MVEIGYVVSVNGENAAITFKRKSGCGDNCATCKAACEANAITTEIKNTVGAKTGDKVKVEMKQNGYNKMIFWVYAFPLIIMTIGIVTGTKIFSSLGYANYEMWSFLLGVVGLAIAYTLLSFVNKKIAKKEEYCLQIVEIIK